MIFKKLLWTFEEWKETFCCLKNFVCFDWNSNFHSRHKHIPETSPPPRNKLIDLIMNTEPANTNVVPYPVYRIYNR